MGIFYIEKTFDQFRQPRDEQSKRIDVALGNDFSRSGSIQRAERRKNYPWRTLHPLLRIDEIDTVVDDDPRAEYSKQAQYGVSARMDLLIQLLKKWKRSGTIEPVGI